MTCDTSGPTSASASACSRHPTLSVASVLTFGLGIGLTTAVFSIVNGVLFKGLPFEEGDRIVLVSGTDTARGARPSGVEVHDYVVFEESQQAFESIGAFNWVSINLVWDKGRPERFSGAALTVGALRATRVEPVLGRAFRDGDDRRGAAPVLLLGYRAWRDHFGGAPDVVGKAVWANGVARTIVGVMPEKFGFPNLEEVWIPLEIDPTATSRGRGPRYEVIARLRRGASITTARAQLSAVAARLAREFPESNGGAGVVVMPFLQRVFGARLQALCRTMLGVGIGVLLIACVNVSNLLLARASLRQREVAVRQALGAGRGRVLAQMLAEASILAALGAVLGVHDQRRRHLLVRRGHPIHPAALLRHLRTRRARDAVCRRHHRARRAWSPAWCLRGGSRGSTWRPRSPTAAGGPPGSGSGGSPARSSSSR